MGFEHTPATALVQVAQFPVDDQHQPVGLFGRSGILGARFHDGQGTVTVLAIRQQNEGDVLVQPTDDGKCIIRNEFFLGVSGQEQIPLAGTDGLVQVFLGSDPVGTGGPAGIPQQADHGLRIVLGWVHDQQVDGGFLLLHALTVSLSVWCRNSAL